MFVLALSLAQDSVFELDFIVNAHMLFPDLKKKDMRRDVRQSILNHCKYFLLLFKFMMNFNQVENVLNWSNLEFRSNPLTERMTLLVFTFILFSSLR